MLATALLGVAGARVPAMGMLPPPYAQVGVPMGTFRGLPPEVLELLGLEPAGDDDEPYELCGP